MSSKIMAATLLNTMMALGHEFSYLGNSTCKQCKEKHLDIDQDGYSVCDVCPFSPEGFNYIMNQEGE